MRRIQQETRQKMEEAEKAAIDNGCLGLDRHDLRTLPLIAK